MRSRLLLVTALAFITALFAFRLKEMTAPSYTGITGNGFKTKNIIRSLTGQKKTAEANKMLLRFRKAFEKSDVKLYGPVF